MWNEISTVAAAIAARVLGAVAVAVAIALGVGGRDATASQMQEWRLLLRKGEGDSLAMEETM